MPIDTSKALNHHLPVCDWSYGPDDVILYHLGLGAGVDPTNPVELQYTYEAGLKVLPTFGVLPAFASLAAISNVPGLEFDPRLLLHGEQDIQVHRPLPQHARVRSVSRIAEIWDKGAAAVAVVETETSSEEGEQLCTNRFTLFLRGEGGFGGEAGPDAQSRTRTPARPPDFVVDTPTLPQQALLYRLCGDKNPLHADPVLAKAAGFPAPILHGLCLYGLACKAVVDTVLAGDVSRMVRFSGRFSGVVYPGETVLTSMWSEGHEVLLECHITGREGPVLSQGLVTLKS